jgi:hypothetical protein
MRGTPLFYGQSVSRSTARNRLAPGYQALQLRGQALLKHVKFSKTPTNALCHVVETALFICRNMVPPLLMM